MTKRRRRLFWLGAAVLVAGFAWTAGFIGFIQRIHRPAEQPPRADGIVALTGGAARIETALHLLQEDRARLLLVSGIGSGVELSVLTHRAGLDMAPIVGRVTLGRAATTTRGNALETAAWVRGHDIHSLIVVTAFYHMPRALTELRRVLTDVTLYPLPVVPPELAGHAEPWLELRLAAEEYSKFLLAWTGLSALLPEREPVAPRHADGGRHPCVCGRAFAHRFMSARAGV